MTQLRFRRAARLAGRFTSLLLAAALSAGCAQTKLVDSWQAEEKVSRQPAKVAVIAVLPEALIRESVERDVAKILQRNLKEEQATDKKLTALAKRKTNPRAAGKKVSARRKTSARSGRGRRKAA